MIVVQNAIQGLDPLRIDVPIQDDPVAAVVFYDLAGRRGQHSFRELSCVVVHVPQELLAGH